MRKVFIFIFFILFYNFIFCQKSNHFTNLNRQDGLSNNFVRTICQDEYGYMWFGTTDGLNRYDGKNVNYYKRKASKENSLSGNYINDILYTSNGKLLIGNNLGLNIFNYKNENFSKVEYLNGTYITRIVEDTNKNIWVVNSKNNVTKLDKDCNVDVDFNFASLIKEKFNSTTSNITVYKFDEDQLMIYVFDKGFYLFNLITNEFKLHLSQTLPQDIGINKIFKISDTEVWVASLKGIFIFENGILTIHLKEGDSAYELNNDFVRDLQKRNENEVWIFTDGGGINVYDRITNKIHYIKKNDRDDFSIGSNFLYSSFVSEDATLWVGTINNGVSQLVDSNIFFTYKLTDLKDDIRSNHPVSSLYLDSKNRIWAGSDGNGLYQIINNEANHVFPADNFKTITSVFEYNPDQLLIGTYRKGVFSINLNNKNILSQYKINNKIGGVARINIIGKNLNKDIFVSGVNTFFVEEKDYKKELIITPSESFLPRQILSSYNSENEFTLYGAYGGLYISTQKDKIRLVSNAPKRIKSIAKFKENQFWLATNRGVCLIDIITKKTVFYGIKSGLNVGRVNSLIKDNEGHLWVGTSKGVSKFDINTRKFINFSYRNGFIDNDFKNPAVIKTNDGRLYFGGTKGVLTFNPKDIKAVEKAKEVVFTKMIINYENSKTQKGSASKFLAKELVLNYKQNIVNFNYSNFEYAYPERITFSYKLEGFDSNWKITNERSLTYMNLKPGIYFLHIKASNVLGEFDANYSSLKLTVLPAWWQTIWFKILMVLMILAIFIVVNFDILRRQKEKRRFQFEKESLENKLELDEQQLRFFTNISHELRTPLSLILSPLEESLKYKGIENNIKENLILAKKNALRIEKLANRAIDYRKTQFMEMELQAEYLDIIPLINELINDFSSLSDEKKMTLTLDCKEEELFLWFDPYMMESILSNIISNAIKYSYEHEEVIIKVIKTEEKLFIEIQDFGQGIYEADKEHIFERFYQAKNHIGGSGIGLALVKNFIEAHKGSVRLDSVIDEGSTFVITMLLGDAHILPENKVDSRINKDSKKSSIKSGGLPSASKSHVEFSEITILIVEDEYDLKEYLMLYLSKSYKVITASNGVEALKILNGNHIDLIVSDVMMPLMDGFELCRRVKTHSEFSVIPFILLTAKKMSMDRRSGYDQGADAFLEKPFQLDVLMSRVENLLASRKALKNQFFKMMNIDIEKDSIDNSDKEFYNVIIKILENHIDNPLFDVTLFSKEIGMSRSVIYKRLSKITNIGINDIMLELRMNRASQLLKHTNKAIDEITILVGYKSTKYFSTSFKKQYSVPPTVYRKKFKEGTDFL